MQTDPHEASPREEGLLLFLQSGTDGVQHPLFIGKLTGVELGIHQVPIQGQLKTTARGRDEFEIADLLFVSGQQLARQTDGLRFIISHGTIFQFDLHKPSLYQGHFHHGSVFPRVRKRLRIS